MVRNTTPTYVIRKIPSALNVDGITKFYLVFRQQNTVVSKLIPLEMLKDPTGIRITLTQKESAKFKVGEVLIQIVGKIGDETVFATNVGRDEVKPILLEGVI